MRSKVVAWVGEIFNRLVMRPAPPKVTATPAPLTRKSYQAWTFIPWRKIFFILAFVLIAYGTYTVFELLWEVSFSTWLTIGKDLIITLIRVLSAVAISTLIAVPIGVWIGSNPRLAQYMMPLTQIAASFPSPLVFSNLFALIVLLHGNLAWGSVVLMMLGTIWYILFNVISGASAVPQDLRACTQLTHLKSWQRWRTLWLPGIFPALTTGWITAAGGAWNTSIASEYLQDHTPPLQTAGLGSFISNAQATGDFPGLTAAVLCMALFVVFFNRSVWKRLAAIAQERFQLLT